MSSTDPELEAVLVDATNKRRAEKAAAGKKKDRAARIGSPTTTPKARATKKTE